MYLGCTIIRKLYFFTFLTLLLLLILYWHPQQKGRPCCQHIRRRIQIHCPVLSGSFSDFSVTHSLPTFDNFFFEGWTTKPILGLTSCFNPASCTRFGLGYLTEFMEEDEEDGVLPDGRPLSGCQVQPPHDSTSATKPGIDAVKIHQSHILIAWVLNVAAWDLYKICKLEPFSWKARVSFHPVDQWLANNLMAHTLSEEQVKEWSGEKWTNRNQDLKWSQVYYVWIRSLTCRRPALAALCPNLLFLAAVMHSSEDN